MTRQSTRPKQPLISFGLISRLLLVCSLLELCSAYSQMFNKAPQAVIHLPQNVFKTKDRVQINTRALSEYLSGLKNLPETLHEHGRLLAQLDHAQLAQHLGQSANAGQLPLISVTEHQDQPAKVTYEVHNPSAYGATPDNSAYQVEPASDGYGTSGDAGGYQAPNMQQHAGGGYMSAGNNEPADKTTDNGYGGKQQQQQQSGGYAPQTESNSYEAPGQSSYEDGSSDGYAKGQSMGSAYQQQQVSDGYSNANNNGPQYGYSGSNAGQQQQSTGGNYEQQMNGYEMMSGGPEATGQAEYSQNYVSDNSPFDFNFVQDILNRVLQQLEQQNISPEQLQAYGEPENGDTHGGSNYAGSSQQGGYAASSAYQTTAPAGYRQQAQSSSSSYGQNYPDQHQTITYRMPTINYEMPPAQIDQLMQAISSGAGAGRGGTFYSSGSQQIPMVLQSSQLRLPASLGKIRTIAVIKSSRLPSIKHMQLTSLTQEGSSQKGVRYATSGSSLVKKLHSGTSAAPIVSPKSSSSPSLSSPSLPSSSSSSSSTYRAPHRKSLLVSSTSLIKQKSKPCDQDKAKAKKKK